MEVKYNIGGLDPDNKEEFNGKYVVVGRLEEDMANLSLYAVDMTGRSQLQHDDIPEYFDIKRSQILGGGAIGLDKRNAILEGKSVNYGSVPESPPARSSQEFPSPQNFYPQKTPIKFYYSYPF